MYVQILVGFCCIFSQFFSRFYLYYLNTPECNIIIILYIYFITNPSSAIVLKKINAHVKIDLCNRIYMRALLLSQMQFGRRMYLKKKKNISSITIQSSTTDNAAKKSAVARAAQKDPIENQGYAIMCPPIQNPRPLPIIPELLSFRLAILGQYLPFHALVPRKRRTKERVPSRQSYDALIKNYHPPTTKGALARHSLSPFLRYSPPSLLPHPPFLFLADTSSSYLSRLGPHES